MAKGLQELDHPAVFLFTVTIGVFATAALLSWLLSGLGWTGPLGLFKGGVSNG
jgi:hypothetical protein